MLFDTAHHARIVGPGTDVSRPVSGRATPTQLETEPARTFYENGSYAKVRTNIEGTTYFDREEQYTLLNLQLITLWTDTTSSAQRTTL